MNSKKEWLKKSLSFCIQKENNIMKKLNIGIICGGQSTEHEISLLSATNILSSISKKKYNIIPIGIEKDGSWNIYKKNDFIIDSYDVKKIHLSKNKTPFNYIFGKQTKSKIEVLFPVLHGKFGEDGTVQGFAKLLNITCVGNTVLGSAIGMDKDVSKRLLREAGILIADYLVFHLNERKEISFDKIVKKLKLPFFIKPAQSGSSVGVHKVKTKKDFQNAVNDAFKFDNKIIIEKMIIGREIECAILGNENPVASLPGEIIPLRDFYSYDAKYLDENGASLHAPANLSRSEIKSIQQTAIKVFKVLECRGLARVDGFLTSNAEFIINEINTMPGFTKISMYPKLLEVSGIKQSELIERLIDLAIKQ